MVLVLFKRWLGKSRKGDGSGHQGRESPETIVARIACGEEELLSPFIAAYEPFIIKATSRFCKRYIDPAHDDEYSIALSGFHEAIRQYEPTAGKSFIGFAETVIRRRLIDHLRKERRHAPSVPYSALEGTGEEGRLNRIEKQQSMRHYAAHLQAEDRRQEIEEFNAQLQRFGISFAELVKSSPKHADSRQTMQRIAAGIAGNAELLELLHQKKQLPIKDILPFAGVTRKTLERNRKFLIALVLIHAGAYPHLHAYLTGAAQQKKGGSEA
ncbi:RNA polymerase sigma factor SigI [Paenibacillus sp. 1P07SE]|uniref:RNA polymerase sigma factor SigI n=1 Tax=Paenibacillus sp. 1P07SE TaxID=3132209 RepID=UPI0039A5F877